MTEADLIFQWSETINRIWNLIQWWGSMSFGLIVLAHLASEKLNRFLLVAIISLYTLYSIWVFISLGLNQDMQQDVSTDLKTLASEGVELGSFGNRLSDGVTNSIANTLITLVVLLGTYISCISYLIYAFRARSSK